MKSKKAINSHVILPKSILEKFSYVDEKGNHIIKYINLNTLKIEEDKTSRFNTQLGYYSRENEKILSDNAESKIGNVIKKIQEIKEDTVFNESDIKSIYKFLAYQVIRTDFFSEKLKEKFNISIENKLIKNIMINDELKLNTVYKVVEDSDIHILINNTKIKFVLPANTMYTFNANSEEYIWIQILSPDIAISFMPRGTIKKLSNSADNNKFKILNFYEENTDIINNFNLRALGVQYKDKTQYRYVIGLDKELKQLINIIKKKGVKYVKF